MKMSRPRRRELPARRLRTRSRSRSTRAARYQRMDGFGASITDSSAHVLYAPGPGHPRRDDARPVQPAAVTGCRFLRQPMGASDFVDGRRSTPTTTCRPGATDYGMRHFSIAHDRRQILPLLRQALALNPQLKVIATPWSPPAWMKTNQSLIGGRLIDDPRDLRRLRDVLREVRAGLPRAPACRSTRSPCRTSRRTATPAATPARTCRWRPGGQADRGARPGAAARAPAHQAPRLRPQLVRAPERHRLDPARPGP